MNTAQCGKFDVHVKSPACVNRERPYYSFRERGNSLQYGISKGGAKHAKSGNARKFMRSLETLHRDSQSPFRLYATRTRRNASLQRRKINLSLRWTKVENAQLNGKADDVV